MMSENIGRATLRTVMLILRNIAYQFSRLHPKAIKFMQEVIYFRRCVRVGSRTLERIFFGRIIARDEPITPFLLGWVAETDIHDAVGDVVSLAGKLSAFGSNQFLKSFFRLGV